MDLATILGIISAFSLVIISIMLGSPLSTFFNVPSVLIVVGGTMGATMINYPLGDVISMIKIGMNTLFAKKASPPVLISNFVDYATRARREGILALEGSVKEAEDDFLVKGLQLTVDGLEPQAIEEILRTEIDYIETRHRQGAEIFQTMGTFAPAMGMIGTLIGLVQMLQSMSDPSTIGPSMAVALLTTFYGSVMANIIFLPMAGKLKKRSSEEVLIKELILDGILSIAKGDNPRILEARLHSFIPPGQRKTSFE
jgi:chemotaxis protein MotA